MGNNKNSIVIDKVILLCLWKQIKAENYEETFKVFLILLHFSSRLSSKRRHSDLLRVQTNFRPWNCQELHRWPAPEHCSVRSQKPWNLSRRWGSNCCRSFDLAMMRWTSTCCRWCRELCRAFGWVPLLWLSGDKLRGKLRVLKTRKELDEVWLPWKK